MHTLTSDAIHAIVACHMADEAARNAPKAVAIRAVYTLRSALADLSDAERAEVARLAAIELVRGALQVPPGRRRPGPLPDVGRGDPRRRGRRLPGQPGGHLACRGRPACRVTPLAARVVGSGEGCSPGPTGGPRSRVSRRGALRAHPRPRRRCDGRHGVASADPGSIAGAAAGAVRARPRPPPPSSSPARTCLRRHP
jgi:hypothetical protein